MASQEHSCFSEAHFCVLPTQSNVYGMCHFCTQTREKVIVACLNGEILLFEYLISETEELRPHSTISRFNYVSKEVISMDGFIKKDGDDLILVIAITFIQERSKDGSEPVRYGLNIFTKPIRDDDKFLQGSSQLATETGLPVALDSVPCQITHTNVYRAGKPDPITVILLSTTDKKVTVYREHMGKRDEGLFKECPDTGQYFPELAGELDDPISFMDFRYFDKNRRRLTCTGTFDGHVHCHIINVPDNLILKRFSSRGLGPVTSVVIFREESEAEIPEFLLPLYQGDKDKHHKLHLLVTHSLEVASVYRDVLADGLSTQIPLRNSYNYDSVMCACVADVDFDGSNELILGTYGQRILAYKFDDKAASKTDCARLLWHHSLQYPIHSIIPLDLTGDGLKDLAVLSVRGLHILQKDIYKAAASIQERLGDLSSGFDKLQLYQSDGESGETNNKS